MKTNLLSVEQEIKIFSDPKVGIVLDKKEWIIQGVETIFATLSAQSAWILLEKFKSELETIEQSKFNIILAEYFNNSNAIHKNKTFIDCL